RYVGHGRVRRARRGRRRRPRPRAGRRPGDDVARRCHVASYTFLRDRRLLTDEPLVYPSRPPPTPQTSSRPSEPPSSGAPVPRLTRFGTAVGASFVASVVASAPAAMR